MKRCLSWGKKKESLVNCNSHHNFQTVTHDTLHGPNPTSKSKPNAAAATATAALTVFPFSLFFIESILTRNGTSGEPTSSPRG